jgi:hypothetical protein
MAARASIPVTNCSTPTPPACMASAVRSQASRVRSLASRNLASGSTSPCSPIGRDPFIAGHLHREVRPGEQADGDQAGPRELSLSS